MFDTLKNCFRHLSPQPDTKADELQIEELSKTNSL